MSWGYHTTIDLRDCDPDLIRSEEHIRRYVKELLSLIHMTPYGDTHCVRFGTDPAVSGYSMFQMIEESNISGHFIEQSNCACIDIFSCLPYDMIKAINFTQKYYEAKRVEYNYIERLKESEETDEGD